MLTLIALVAAVVVVTVAANWKLQFFKWDLLDEMKKLDGKVKNLPPSSLPESKPVTVEVSPTVARVETPAVTVSAVAKPQRARNKKGKFVGDKPETAVVNEAWVGGQAPSKKTASRRRKPDAKK